MPEPSVTEYRLGELEKKVDGVLKKLDELPEKLDQRYALKSDFDGYVEEQKTKRTGNRTLITGLVVSGSAVLLGAFVTFMVWVVNTLVHVQNVGGTP